MMSTIVIVQIRNIDDGPEKSSFENDRCRGLRAGMRYILVLAGFDRCCRDRLHLIEVCARCYVMHMAVSPLSAREPATSQATSRHDSKA